MQDKGQDPGTLLTYKLVNCPTPLLVALWVWPSAPRSGFSFYGMRYIIFRSRARGFRQTIKNLTNHTRRGCGLCRPNQGICKMALIRNFHNHNEAIARKHEIFEACLCGVIFVTIIYVCTC